MLTFEDCLGLCELTAEQIAAIARHEHLPEMLALELGAHLSATAQGRQQIRRMIEYDLAAARKRGDDVAAGQLDLALRSLRPATEAGAGLEQRLLALGVTPDAMAGVRQRVETYLVAMGHRFGLDLPGLRQTHQLELLVADTRCAACDQGERCGSFLAGTAAGDDPARFCANAQLFLELR